MKKSDLPGVTVHKSLTAALDAVKGELERQHFATIDREKAKATKAKKARRSPPG